jgi:hypothetical protein
MIISSENISNIDVEKDINATEGDSVAVVESFVKEKEIDGKEHIANLYEVLHRGELQTFNKVELPQLHKFLVSKLVDGVFELRISKLKDILNAIMDYKESFKPVVLLDTGENLNYWLSALEAILPQKLTKSINIKPIENCDILGCKGCYIFLDNQQKSETTNTALAEDHNKPYTFDFRRGICDRVLHNSRFSETIMVNYLLGEEDLHTLHSFIECFNYTMVDKNLDTCLDLYYMIHNGLKNSNYDTINSSLKFFQTYADANSCRMLLKQVISSFCSCSSVIDEKSAYTIISTLLKVSNRFGEDEDLWSIYSFFYDCVQNQLEYSEEKAYSFYIKITDIEDINTDKFLQYSLGEHNINKFSVFTEGSGKKYALFYLSIVLELMKGASTAWIRGSVQDTFIIKCIYLIEGDFAGISSVINKTKDNLEYSANLIILFYNKISAPDFLSNEAFQLYMQIINNLGDKAELFRGYTLNITGGFAIAYDEYRINVLTTEKKDEFFNRYSAQVFDKFPSFKDMYYANALKFYLDLIKDEPYYYKECAKIINKVNNKQISISDSALEAIIEDYENEIPFKAADLDIKEMYRIIENIRIERNMPASSTFSSLIEYGIKLEKADSTKSLCQILISTTPLLEGLSHKRKLQFTEWCLNILFSSNFSRIEDVLYFYRKISSNIKGGSESFINTLLSVKNISSVTKNSSLIFNHIKPKQVQFYIVILIKYMDSKDHSWEGTGIYEQFITECFNIISMYNKLAVEVLDLISDTKQFFANMLINYYIKLGSKGNVVINYFIDKCIKSSNQWNTEISGYISNIPQGNEFLFLAFTIMINREEDKIRSFWNYAANYFTNVSSYKENYFAKALQYYLSALEEGENYISEGIMILELVVDEDIEISKEVIDKIIKGFEETIPLTAPGAKTKNTISRLKVLKEKYDITTKPDIVDAMCIAIEFETASEEDIIERVKKSKDVLLGVDPYRYEDYIRWCLPTVFSRTNPLWNNDIIKSCFFIKEYSDIFDKVYNDLLLEQINSGELRSPASRVLEILLKLDLSPEEYADIVMTFYSRSGNEEELKDTLEIFRGVINYFNQIYGLKLRKHVSGILNGDVLLFKEYLYSLKEALNVDEYFWSYVNKIMNKLPDYKNGYYKAVVFSYVEVLESDSNYNMSFCKLLSLIEGSETNLDEELEMRIVLGCERLLWINNVDNYNEDFLQALIRIKESKNIHTLPDMISFADFARKFSRTRDNREILVLLTETTINFDKLHLVKYEEFLDYFLPKVVLCVNEWSTHALIKKSLCMEKRKVLFLTKYTMALYNLTISDSLEGSRIFAEFIIYIFNSLNNKEEEVYIPIKTNLISVLYRLSLENLRAINGNVINSLIGMRNREFIQKEWEIIYKNISSVSKRKLLGVRPL